MYGDMGPGAGEGDAHEFTNNLDENDEAFYCEAPKFGTAAFKENPCYDGEGGDDEDNENQPTYDDAGYLDMEPNAQPAAAADSYGKIERDWGFYLTHCRHYFIIIIYCWLVLN